MGKYMGVSSSPNRPTLVTPIPDMNCRNCVYMKKWLVLITPLPEPTGDGQVKMFREAALGLADAAKERRDNMQEKIVRVVEIINRPENKDDHFLFMA